jgi:hypothetical protein
MRVAFTIILLLIITLLRAQPSLKACKASHDSIDGMKVMMVTEEMAKYRSGEREMVRALLDSIQFPKGEKLPLEKIYVEWVVDTLGNVRNPCILMRANKMSLLEKEILRVVPMLKDWTPARHKGKKVPVLVSLPIHFTPQE